MVKNKGFTLIENITAIVLIGIVITATIFSFVSARVWVSMSRRRYQAVCLAREEIEKIIAGEVDSSPKNYLNILIDGDTGLLGNMAVTNPTLTSVDITVSWTEPLLANMAVSETLVFILP